MKVSALEAFIVALSICDAAVGREYSKSRDAVLLRDIDTLTFYKNRLTTYRRVEPIPQITVLSSDTAARSYLPETVRCKNAGLSYTGEDVQWTCSTSLPPELRLGSTDVVCEGFDSAEDPYVLKGSCGVEIRLVLTTHGEKKFASSHESSFGGEPRSGMSLEGMAFGILFIGMLLFIVGSALREWFRGASRDHPRAPRRGHGRRNYSQEGHARGGDDDDDDDDDGDDNRGPPPPYDSMPRSHTKKKVPRSSPTHRTDPAVRGYRPGFWSGAAAGAAGGYLMSRRAGSARDAPDSARETRTGSSYPGRQTSSGPSRIDSHGGFSDGDKYESTGFGGTRRR